MLLTQEGVFDPKYLLCIQGHTRICMLWKILCTYYWPGAIIYRLISARLWTIFRDSVDFVQKLRFRLLMLRKLPISALQELEK